MWWWGEKQIFSNQLLKARGSRPRGAHSDDDFFEGFPTVTREGVISLLEEFEKEFIDRVA
ncbi:MAG: hypothetical protein DWQ51_16765 [Microcystis wesenbergii TW10]|uniref:Uncharacterized protein n=2 Tax=Microcystis TaxID=1125 RepID=A0A552ACB4_MICAE|nr:MAG: hypothetical protein DWQ51_16765 [Microcystis wesenbergii TW10]TRT83099.1 MAG: hypothetical protein EWV63_18150 [Microcystis aeruginosa Ma_OC_H_19870700_S124]